MDWTQRLNAALDSLEDSWDREPDLEQVAALANCSPFHFLRMFEVVSGLTPGEYSRRRRLSRAAVDLAVGQDKVIDVALRYGYETPEAFTKAFKRLFGLTPREAKVPGVALETWPPLRLAVVLKGERAMRYRIVEQPAFEAVGWALRTTKSAGENLVRIPEFWKTCHDRGQVAALQPLCGPLGMLGLCAEMDSHNDTFTYLIGVQKETGRVYPAGTRSLAVPSATYAVFTAVGPMPHAIQNAWKAAYSEWFPTSGYEHAGTMDFEAYPWFPEGDERGNPESPECVTEVWIPLKKKAPL